MQWYRVEAFADLPLPIPFIIAVDRDQPHGWIAGGAEELPTMVLARDPLRIRIPVRGSELRFKSATKEGPLEGQWLVSYYFKRDFDIKATPVSGPGSDILFPGTDAPRADFSGEWHVDLQTFGEGRAVFNQRPNGDLDGTIIPPEIGDLRYLRGRVLGDRAYLSVFDGMHCFLVVMTMKPGGRELEGDWEIAGIGNIKFSGNRTEAPSTHTKMQARLAPGKTRVTMPGLDEAPYAGNPVIIDFMATWCPGCIDLTPELVRLRERYGAQGLQIRSIDIEPTGDEAEIQRRLAELKATYRVTWPIELRITDDPYSQVPPEILDATGYPITIFLRRDHTVAAIHTGFVSPAAKVEHQQAVEQLDRLAAEIVSPAAATTPRR